MKKYLFAFLITCLGLTVNGYGQQIITTQDFESPTVAPTLPANWSQGSTGSPGWVTGTNVGSTWSSIGGYNVPAHTQYVAVDDVVHPSNLHDTLKSAVFSLAGISNAWMSYDYFFLGAALSAAPNSPETCHILGSSNGGTSWSIIGSVTGMLSTGVNDWTTAYANLSSLSGANCQIAFVYSDGGHNILGCALDNIQVIKPATNDLAFTSLTPVAGSNTSFGLANSSVTLNGSVQNNGITPITSFDLNYTIGTGTVVSSTISGVNIQPFTTYNFTKTITMPGIAGSYPVKVWVALAGDSNASNDSAGTTLSVATFMPTKRLMFEEATGTWCGFCVRGIVYMDSLWSLHPFNASIVSIHDYNTYDPMAEENTLTQHYDAFISGEISGYPQIIVDRTIENDPSGTFTDYANMINNFGFADISVASTVTDGTLNTMVSVKPAVGLTGDYRLEMIVTEDSVHGTSGGYLQHNYYSSTEYNTYHLADGSLEGQGVDYYDLPFAIPNEYYKFVARYTVPDMATSPNGVANSLPATMTAGATYNYSFSPVTIASDWVSKNLRVIAMLIDNNPGNITYGQVLNSANTTWPLSVPSVASGIEEVHLFPNPANQEVHVAFSLQETSSVQLSIYDAVGRLVYNVPAQSLSAGDQLLSISTTGLAAGIYNVKIQTETGNVTQRLSVIK